MSGFDHLSWDSELFGFAVGRILPDIGSAAALQPVIANAKQSNIRVLYWIAEPVAQNRAAASQLGGLLVDTKRTYVRPLPDLALLAELQNPEPDSTPAPTLASFFQRELTVELEELAVAAGLYSRFRTDARFGEDAHRELYRMWIRNSLSGAIADEVLCAVRDECPVGLITLGKKADRCDIGLVAVAAGYRGQGLAASLIRGGLRWSLAQGLDVIQVVTQAANRPACRLYESQGFSLESEKLVFHFWL